MATTRFFVLTLVSLALMLGFAGTAAAQGVSPVDHYMCYRALDETGGVEAPIMIRDQFDQYVQAPRWKRVKQARFVCNPAAKTHNGVVTEPMYPDFHLVCYNVVPKRALPFPLYAYSNQFGDEVTKAAVEREEMICVPSFKRPQVPGSE